MDENLKIFLQALGKKIKSEREARKFTLEDMEFHTGIDGSDFNKIEQGKTNLTFRTFLKVAKGLNIQPQKLLDFRVDLERE